ncbi:MAG: radical SAM protein [Ignavibacterium sp.]|uniref:radical SAM protein n=1 Tax=Ignavibacterium sp. TaxID=2651167 RepID=UPI00404B9E90
MQEFAFGPVPSRRFGKSLGVNNIPPKICTYSCVYCQLGRSLKMTVRRQEFYKPQEIFESVRKKVQDVISRGGKIDYITFVPDGEPTLDLNLGKEASLIKELGIPLAIITNSSLIWDENVRKDLMNFCLVSVKVDAVSQELWRKIDRSFKDLDLELILEGIKKFDEQFKGVLISETMLVDAIDYGDEFEKVANFLSSLKNLNTSYISIPTRPPAEDWTKPPKEEILNEAFQIFAAKLGNRVEYLIGYEGNAFAYSGDIKEDLLSITAVHPLREEAVKELLKKDVAEWDIVEKLIEEGLLRKVNYNMHTYYLRKFK